MISISAYFYDHPGGGRDKACHWIFKQHGGKFIGSGTMMVGAAAGERDVQYHVPNLRATPCRKALKAAGFRLQPTPDPMAKTERVG